MRNRRLLEAGLALAVGLATFAGSCNPPTEPGDVTIVNNNTNNIGGQGGNGGPAATPGASGPCLPVARVGVKAHGTNDDRSCTVTVGSTCTADATPKDAADNIRPDQCNLNDGITWAVSGPCTVQGASSFTPQIKGDAQGTCHVTARVKDVFSNDFLVTVSPRPTLWELLGAGGW